MTGDACKLIADVHYKHEWQGGILGCRCRWNWPGERTYFCGEEERIRRAHSEHVAAEVDKALGGLTRITQPEYPARWDAGVKICDAGRLVSRWVSDWSEAQP